MPEERPSVELLREYREELLVVAFCFCSLLLRVLTWFRVLVLRPCCVGSPMVNPRPVVLRTAFSELRDVTTRPVVRPVRVAFWPLLLHDTVVASPRVELPRLELRVAVCPLLEAAVSRSLPLVARTA